MIAKRTALVMAGILAGAANSAVTVDFSKEVGKMRPELHSSGFGPQICSCSKRTIDELKSMGFKASRTHDWSLLNPNQRVCDYFQMFPLMHLDATKPENYYFGPTDHLLKRTREELGHEVFFRLGTSIEHSGPDIHFNTQIPDDFDKVAEIFAGTIRHYNKGWANGHNWDIKYWEIWNEPDNMNCMWCLPDGDGGKGATPEERMADLQRRENLRRELFVKFFVTCLKRIKSEFPDIKVGGPALCTWRDDKEPVMTDGAPSAWTRKYRNTSAYFRAILSACKEANVAPDFISWHYSGKNPDDVMAAIAKARRLCDEMGFPNCELIINEWHYRARSWGELGSPDPKVRRSVWTGPASHNGIDSSCFNLTLLSRFQTSALDQSFYYGCKNIGNWGYKDTFGEKYKVYYGLKMFGDFLRDYPVICASSSDKKGVTVIAAKSADSKRKAALVTDYCSKSASLTVKFNDVAPDAKCKILVHDYERDLETVDAKLVNGSLTLPKKDTNSAAFVVMF